MKILTVIISDTGGMINAGLSQKYRSVQIKLTPEQEQAIQLRNDYEQIDQCFIEPEESP